MCNEAIVLKTTYTYIYVYVNIENYPQKSHRNVEHNIVIAIMCEQQMPYEPYFNLNLNRLLDLHTLGPPEIVRKTNEWS